MKESKTTKEGKFDFFLNKTIILSSKKYFVKQAEKQDYEKMSFNNESFSSLLQDFSALNNTYNDFEQLELKLELENYKNCLSQIEQSVLFLLFNEDLTQDEAGKILNMYSQAINRIKMRAIKKLKKSMNEGDENEE